MRALQQEAGCQGPAQQDTSFARKLLELRGIRLFAAAANRQSRRSLKHVCTCVAVDVWDPFVAVCECRLFCQHRRGSLLQPILSAGQLEGPPGFYFACG